MQQPQGNSNERKRYWRANLPTSGSYTIDPRGTRFADPATDSGRWEIWQHIWACRNFADYFAKAPRSATKNTRSGSHPITRESEMAYALALRYVLPGTNTK